HDLHVEVKSGSAKDYQGTVSYRNGRLQFADTKPLPHNLTAHFVANSSEFTLNPLILSVALSTLRLEGRLQNYADPFVTGSYLVTVHPRDITSGLKSASISNGDLTRAGSVEYRHQTNVPPAQAVTVNGQLHGHELAIDNADLHMVIHNMY